MSIAITKKIGMTRIFDRDGISIPVTLLKLENSVISRIKKADSKDGYDAVVVSKVNDKKSKPKANKNYEFRVENINDYKVGDILSATAFEVDSEVSLYGKAKGKGFAGTIKRHGFHRGPVSHGSKNIRKPGSIGGGYPQRVVAGKKMAGRMGGHFVTVKNVKIVHINQEEGVISVKGAVPGPQKSLVKLIAK